MADMRIAKLLLYPIKSLRAIEVNDAIVTELGFPHDRRFMLLESITKNDGSVEHKNVQVSRYHNCVLFYPSLIGGSDGTPASAKLEITFRPEDQDARSINFPLEPDTNGLDVVDIVMYKSSTKGYVMEQRINQWFSDCFGTKVILAYLGDNRRPVRMSHNQPKSKSTASTQAEGGSWLGGISSIASATKAYVLGGNSFEATDSGAVDTAVEPVITFADVAPYLIVSERSMDDLHIRLPEGNRMDITKFRPNVIVSGASEPWEEDFWGELTIAGATRIACVHNCGRCQSINVDYKTGAIGTSEAGSMLKKMSRDRRVDPGMKYSPIFGRYSFLQPGSQGQRIRVGDAVEVTKTNSERTIFDWDGLATN